MRRTGRCEKKESPQSTYINRYDTPSLTLHIIHGANKKFSFLTLLASKLFDLSSVPAKLSELGDLHLNIPQYQGSQLREWFDDDLSRSTLTIFVTLQSQHFIFTNSIFQFSLKLSFIKIIKLNSITKNILIKENRLLIQISNKNVYKFVANEKLIIVDEKKLLFITIVEIVLLR